MKLCQPLVGIWALEDRSGSPLQRFQLQLRADGTFKMHLQVVSWRDLQILSYGDSAAGTWIPQVNSANVNEQGEPVRPWRPVCGAALSYVPMTKSDGTSMQLGGFHVFWVPRGDRLLTPWSVAQEFTRSDMAAATALAAASSTVAATPAAALPTPHLPVSGGGGAATAAVTAPAACYYGTACYNTDEEHLRRFSHLSPPASPKAPVA